MKYLGIIFDFNGTLFFDSDKHEEAWRIFSKKLRGNSLDDEELQKVMHGRTNKSLIEYLLGASIDDEKLFQLSEQKEQIYREMCIKDITNFKLTLGAIELLDYLKEKQIPYTIATASGKTNLSFYFENLNLNKWFDLNKIAFDDGLILSKPEPDIYLKAAAKIGIKPEKCIVVEDAISGIESAYRANIGKIIAIGPENKHENLKNLKGVNYVISNFKEFDRNIFW
ncbi:haloacid dehalogenase superfamily, subfamily IA, variant 3 with third motif having DD or ED [Pelosinus fermentans]|uniref:HAD family hydrolase n=1 Tax=Pelosinus fermentans TaxID=365349 RepID=UPI000268630D|nr:HAD family phosphatase [Pelosinus fermentans]OAM92445.1 HAD-superfamily hydrolase, subfamily IA, variant 3 [Pelosinus fermentans DSM 17108]SDQ45128.1 haloacid dehalogenase superfamily, subfamily IA, variant 3 with third motif having DD or ED [Pelosinus fermentans]